MKTIKYLSIILFSLIILGACEDSVQDPPQSSIDNIEDIDHSALVPEELRHRTNRGYGKPFIAKFYTIRSYDEEEEGQAMCTEDPFLAFNLQVGEGKGTHLGKFTTSMRFCSDLATFTYKNGRGLFVAANGDELYFNVPSTGEVGNILPLPFEHHLYEFYFADPFEFDGGTGRFAGASGMGYTLSFVDLFDDDGEFIPEHRTDHRWFGKLILPKRK